MDKKTLAKYLDLANHHQNATESEIKTLCQQVKKFGFNSAFVNPCFIVLAKDALEGKALVGSVVSFPLGQDSRDIKILAAIDAVRKGADEIDVSANVGLFKSRKVEEYLEEMKAVVEAAKSTKARTIVKLIIETGWLTNEEIKKASELVLESGADFVKTCSGMGPRGASLKDVALIKSAVGGKIKIKIAGGVNTYKEAIDFISAGADRIGTSKAVEIIKEANES